MASEVSSEAIQAHIHSLLANPETNIKWLPDSIEAKLYTVAMEGVLKTLAKVCDETQVEIFGHVLKVVVVPKNPKV
jgi:hypothetical protein